MRQHTVLWCVGNPLLQDDGAGPALFALLEVPPSEHLCVVNCETTPENFITPLKRSIRNGSVRLLIVDAAEMGLPGGSLRRMRLDEFAGVVFGTHGIPLPTLLAPLLPELDVTILCIQPSRRGFGNSLSPEVAQTVETLALLLMEGRWDEVEPYQENCSPR